MIYILLEYDINEHITTYGIGGSCGEQPRNGNGR